MNRWTSKRRFFTAHDLDRLQSGKIKRGGRTITVRTPVTGDVGTVFRAVGVALPPNVAEEPTA